MVCAGSSKWINALVNMAAPYTNFCSSYKPRKNPLNSFYEKGELSRHDRLPWPLSARSNAFSALARGNTAEYPQETFDDYHGMAASSLRIIGSLLQMSEDIGSVYDTSVDPRRSYQEIPMFSSYMTERIGSYTDSQYVGHYDNKMSGRGRKFANSVEGKPRLWASKCYESFRRALLGVAFPSDVSATGELLCHEEIVGEHDMSLGRPQARFAAGGFYSVWFPNVYSMSHMFFDGVPFGDAPFLVDVANRILEQRGHIYNQLFGGAPAALYKTQSAVECAHFFVHFSPQRRLLEYLCLFSKVALEGCEDLYRLANLDSSVFPRGMGKRGMDKKKGIDKFWFVDHMDFRSIDLYKSLGITGEVDAGLDGGYGRQSYQTRVSRDYFGPMKIARELIARERGEDNSVYGRPGPLSGNANWLFVQGYSCDAYSGSQGVIDFENAFQEYYTDPNRPSLRGSFGRIWSIWVKLRQEISETNAKIRDYIISLNSEDLEVISQNNKLGAFLRGESFMGRSFEYRSPEAIVNIEVPVGYLTDVDEEHGSGAAWLFGLAYKDLLVGKHYPQYLSSDDLDSVEEYPYNLYVSNVLRHKAVRLIGDMMSGLYLNFTEVENKMAEGRR